MCDSVREKQGCMKMALSCQQSFNFSGQIVETSNIKKELINKYGFEGNWTQECYLRGDNLQVPE